MAKAKTTRNTNLNYYINSQGAMASIATMTATTKYADVTLLDSNEAIELSGYEIIDDADKNINSGYFLDRDGNLFIREVDSSTINSNEKYSLYGSPHKWVLDNRQQYENCGLDSTLNILVMAGKKTITNQNKTETAFTKQLWSLGLADDDGKLGVFDSADGGTSPAGYKEILEYYGITDNVKAYASKEFGYNQEVDGYSATLDQIETAIKNGGAAIVGVCADLLWQETDPNLTMDHAILVTGIVYNSSDELVGFYIHDTGFWMTRYISKEEFMKVTLYENTNDTWKTETGIFGTIIGSDIKSLTNNINVTGTKYANKLIGNSGDNVIKGLAGNDILIGKAGNDKIYGGKGNDIIFGNGIINYDTSDIKDETIKTKLESLTSQLEDEETEKNLVGRNVLYGDAGNDYIFGGNYNDLIYGGSGNDYIRGGSGIDVIYGGSGNDIIYGDDGDDKIYGQSGNDTIYGGKGNDIIICGSGNDTVVFEEDCGYDKVSSSSGTLTLKFTNWSASDLIFETSGSNLEIYIDDENGVGYRSFYNSKKNKSQTAYIVDKNSDKYRLFETKSKGKIKVANTKGNNILFSTSTKSNTITTSVYNDIIYMSGGDDTITYTGGRDYYHSSGGNNTYKVNTFNENTFLSIDDSAGENDKLYINTSKDNLSIFFNVTVNNIEEQQYGLGDIYILDKIVYSDEESYSDFVNNIRSEKGCLRIENYFEYEEHGQVEHVYTKEDNVYTETSLYNIAYDVIANNVANWLSKHTDYTSAFDAITNCDTQEDLSTLISYYSNTDLT